MTTAEKHLDLRQLSRDIPGRRSFIWAGMALFIVIEATVVVALITSYYYIRVMAEAGWPPPDVERPAVIGPMLALLALVLTLGPVWWARRAYRRGERMRFVLGVALGCILLAGYLAAALMDMLTLPYLWSEHAYGSLVWTLSGYQLLHGGGLLTLGVSVLVVGSRVQGGGRGQTGNGRGLPREAAVEALALYWAFVVVASVPMYFTIYLVSHLS